MGTDRKFDGCGYELGTSTLPSVCYKFGQFASDDLETISFREGYSVASRDWCKIRSGIHACEHASTRLELRYECDIQVKVPPECLQGHRHRIDGILLRYAMGPQEFPQGRSVQLL